MPDSRLQHASDADLSAQEHLLHSMAKRHRRRRYAAISTATIIHLLLVLGIWFAVPDNILKFDTAPVIDIAFSSEATLESQFTQASPEIGDAMETRIKSTDSKLSFEELDFDHQWPQNVAEQVTALQNQAAANAGKVVRRLHASAQMTTLEELYLNLWQRRVESVGALNIPQDVIRQGLEGRVIVRVRVESDGTVSRTDIIHATGAPEYKSVVESILLLSAPFPPFPDELKQEVDAVDVIRVWNFELV